MTTVDVFNEAAADLGSRLNADYYNNSQAVRTVPTRMWFAYAGTTGSITVVVER